MRLLALFLIVLPIFGQQSRTITNFDLEKYRQQRIEAESEYLRTYRSKNMPSPEEIEKIAEEKKRQASELAQRISQEKSSLEEYFQRRANEIRLNLASLDAQITYLRRALSEETGYYRGGLLSRPILAGSFLIGVGKKSFVNSSSNISSNIPPNVRMVQSYSMGVPTATDIRNLANGFAVSSVVENAQTSFRGLVFLPVIIDNTDYRRERLIAELQNLERIRIGLSAELAELQEQARRAGVKIH
ncbi:MAG: hypothetical protein N2Z23_04745 [Pyrinomonadaceae bacterium]|nr:hypothetical protein [Pyrinomonadaceae bacterium]MCX7639731.1 hypothetical protein [Pyrinomonadaceae bacterium]